MKKNKRKSQPKTISNRRARFDYDLQQYLTVGLELNGREVKSLRMGHGQLRGAYVNVKDNELWLINATINSSPGISLDETEQTRTRKLLAKRREIDQLVSAKQNGQSIVPLELLTGGKFIKLKIAVGKGKKQYDKRQTLKRRDETRQIHTELKRGR